MRGRNVGDGSRIIARTSRHMMIRAERGVVTDGSYRPGYCLNSLYHNAVFAFVRFRVISCVTYDPGSWSPRNPDHTCASKPIYIYRCRVANEHLAGAGIWSPSLPAGWKIVGGCGGATAGLWVLRPAGILRRAAAALRRGCGWAVADCCYPPGMLRRGCRGRL
jgi:hypothetical protein